MSKEKATRDLQRFDVITSSQFNYGMRRSSLHDEKPIEVGFEQRQEHDDASDQTRAQARFVVLNAGYGGQTESFAGPHDLWWEVTAQRLADDGSYNPTGEIILFKSGGWECNVDQVTCVGCMALSFVPAQE